MATRKSISDLAPCLTNAVGPRIKKQRTVAQALNGDAWVRDIAGALTVQVILDYFLIWDLTRDIQLDENSTDAICWKWTSDRVFTTASAYRSFFIGNTRWRELDSSARHVRRQNANFSFG